jgi:hypothetical protein
MKLYLRLVPIYRYTRKRIFIKKHYGVYDKRRRRHFRKITNSNVCLMYTEIVWYALYSFYVLLLILSILMFGIAREERNF